MKNRDFLDCAHGKINYVYWCIVGDDFDVTKWNFQDFPIDLKNIPKQYSDMLYPIVEELEEAMLQNVTYKINAGKKAGNYNLAKCRHVTDKSDKIFAEYLGLSECWEEIELFYTKMVRTDFNEN